MVMLRACVLALPALLPALLLAACSGGGGGPAAAAAPLRLAANAVVLAGSATTGELVVMLPLGSGGQVSLLEVSFELPPALTVAGLEPLQPLQPMPTLDGNLTGGRYRVVCGDAQNQVAAGLASGPLFRLRLLATNPRQVGSHTVRMLVASAARSEGARIAVDPNPTVVSVTLQ